LHFSSKGGIFQFGLANLTCNKKANLGKSSERLRRKDTVLKLCSKWNCTYRNSFAVAPGPALASAGPIGSTFAGPHSIACAEISGMHEVMIEIVDVQERGQKGRNRVIRDLREPPYLVYTLSKIYEVVFMIVFLL